MVRRHRTEPDEWKKTYEKHGTDIVVGFKGLMDESAKDTKNCLKKYTS